jgi:hypothetical protein
VPLLRAGGNSESLDLKITAKSGGMADVGIIPAGGSPSAGPVGRTASALQHWQRLGLKQRQPLVAAGSYHLTTRGLEG